MAESAKKKKYRGTRRIETDEVVFKFARFSPSVSDTDGHAYTSPNLQKYSESS